MQPLLRSLGDGAPSAGEETAREVGLCASATEICHGGVQLTATGLERGGLNCSVCGRSGIATGTRNLLAIRSCCGWDSRAPSLQNGPVERGAAEREVVQGEIEKRRSGEMLGPFERLCRPLLDGVA